MAKPTMRKINISKVVRDGLCTGCGTCAGVCPQNAVTLPLHSRKGIYIPTVDKETCNDCGICFAACPGHAVDFKSLGRAVSGEQARYYLGCATNHDIRNRGASGGVVTALLVSALESGRIDGALVTGMNPDCPWETRSYIARTREEIINAAKSKYCPAPANTSLKEILANPGRYAVVGLPCYIQGVRKAAAAVKMLDRRIMLAISLCCSHNDTFHAVRHLLKKYGKGGKMAGLTGLDFRGPGWPGYFTAHFKGGSTVSVPYDEYIFFHTMWFFAQPRCTLCCDFSGRLSDITVMDAWLPEIRKRDKIGTSILITNTATGLDYLEKARQTHAVSIEPISQARALSSQGQDRLLNQDLGVFFSLRKMLRKKVPDYDIDIPRPGFRNWLRAGVIQFNVTISNSAWLRWMVNPISIVARMITKLRSRA